MEQDHRRQLWDLFTAREEYDCVLKDRFNRTPYWSSKNRDVFRPTVSEYLLGNGLTPSYPNDKRFALCLTHDIDTLFDNPTLRQNVKNGVRGILNRDVRGVMQALRATIKKEINPKFRIGETLKYEREYGAKSSFYFLSLAPGEDDFNYDPFQIREVFDEIVESGGEIGLHGGHLAYDSVPKIREEKQRLEAATGRTVDGYRNHYLRFATPTTWECLDKVQFKYDTTYGFPDCVGFRNGMCHPFNPYNLKTRTFLGIVELPLVIMDSSLWGYMRLDESAQIELCKALIDHAARNKGVLTLLWHNTQMQGHPGRLYSAILEYANAKGAWMTTAREVVDSWTQSGLLERTNILLRTLRDSVEPKDSDRS